MSTAVPSSKPPRAPYDWDRPPEHPFHKRRRRNRKIAFGFIMVGVAVWAAVAADWIKPAALFDQFIASGGFQRF
jgi:hypothetical protein